MAESCEILITADTKLRETFCALTPLQERIFTFLKSNPPSKAVSIAKGVGKTTAKDVNPDLYKMKILNLLSHDEQGKLWTANTGLAHTLSGSPNVTSEDSNPNRSYIEMDGCKVSDNKDARRDSGIEADGKTENRRSVGKMLQISEQQERIFTFLKSNPPSKATSIAKGVGKTTAKEVNPDLYKMKSLNLLSYNEQGKLWTINTGLTHTSGSPNASSEDSSPDPSYIEIDGCKVPDKEDIRRDSGIEMTNPYPDNTIRDEPNLMGPPSEESYLQYGLQMVNPQPNIKIYNIRIEGCHNFSIGDNITTKGEPEPIREDYEHCGHFSYGPDAPSDFLPHQTPAPYTCPPWQASDQIITEIGDNGCHHEARDPGMAAQEAEQQHDSALGDSQQSGEDLISELSLLNTEEDGGPSSAPRTSSPAPPGRCDPTLNISGICDGLGNVTLDDRDNNGEERAVIPSSGPDMNPSLL